MTVKEKKICEGDLLFHPVHGLCRVQNVKAEGAGRNKEAFYKLVPKTQANMKISFVIASSELKTSGFHGLVSAEEAGKILDYLKAGVVDANPLENGLSCDPTFANETRTWALARDLLTSSTEKWESRDLRKRQKVERSARGLVEELSFVLNEPRAYTAEKVKDSLGKVSGINPAVINALNLAKKY